MDTISYIFHEGQYYNEEYEPVDLLEITLANEKAEIILRHPDKTLNESLLIAQRIIDEQNAMRLLLAKQEIGFYQKLFRATLERKQVGT